MKYVLEFGFGNGILMLDVIVGEPLSNVCFNLELIMTF
jgi:hypothetical protein